MAKIKWSKYIPHKPTPKQLIALSSTKKELLFGGALGGGKSDFLLMSCLQYMDVPGYAAAIFRKQLTDLKQPGALLDRSQKWLSKWKREGVKYVPSEHTYYFPTVLSNGRPGEYAKLVFCYVGEANARDRYQSAEYQTICFDEISQWETDSDYEFMTTRLRRTTCKTHGKLSNGKPNWVDGCPECEIKRNIPVRLRAACVDFGKVLTRTGWKPIQEVLKGEEVLSVNANGEAEWKPVIDVYHCKHKGKLVRIQKRNLFCSFTKDHRVTYRSGGGKGLFKIIPWDQHNNKSIDLVRAALKPAFEGKPFPIPCGIDRAIFIRFLGLYLGDGSVGHNPRKGNYKVIITQLSDNVPLIEGVLSKMGLKYNRSNNGDYQFTNKELWTYLVRLGYAKDKHVPREVMENLSGEEGLELLKHLLGTDGSQRINSNTFTTTSERLRDDVMALAVMFGYKVQTTSYDDGHTKHNRKHVIYLTLLPNPVTKVDKDIHGRNDVHEVPYDGMVYCIKVADNENFFLEQNGYVWVSGNTNPGGLGGNWIKQRFQIIPDPKIYPDRREAIKDAMNGIRVPFIGTHPQRDFVPSYIDDNPYLDLHDYSEFLDNLQPELKAQLKDGNWEARADSRFKRQWIRYFELYDHGFRLGPTLYPFSEFTKIFTTVDLASTVKEGIIDSMAHRKAPSFTVFSTWGINRNNDLFFLDMVRFRQEVPDIVEEGVHIYAKWKPAYFKVEFNGVGAGPGQYFQRLGIPVKKNVKTRDKIENSIGAMLLMKAGKVYFPINKEWLEEAENEIFGWIGLPSETDDIIDTLSDAANEIGPVSSVITNEEDAKSLNTGFLRYPAVHNMSPTLSFSRTKSPFTRS